MITYNHADYISRAIESVLAQKTDFSFELVIGDDCSTDGTREIVYDYARRFPDIIRVISSSHNVGMRNNNNRVIGALRGKYISWCEGDDFWHRQDKLQIQADYLESHPNCGLAHSDQNRYFEDGNVCIESFYKKTNNIPPDKYNIFEGWNGYHILTCTVMARKCLVDEIMKDGNIYSNENYIGGCDIPLFIELSMVSSHHYINESLATYTVRSDSACHFTDIAKQTKFSLSVLGAYLYLANKYNAKNEADILLGRYIDAALNCALWNNDIGLAKSTFIINRFNIKQRIMYYFVLNSITSRTLKLILGMKYGIKKKRFQKSLFAK
jgi:glycosyltransferase involved in cell wall biosynthesis